MMNDANRDREQLLFRSLMEASLDPIIIHDIEGEIIYVNKAFTIVFGWTKDEISGLAINFGPDDVQPATQNGISTALTGEIVSTFQARRLTKDGRIIDVDISWTPFYDHREKKDGLIVILRDISEKKSAEKAFRESEAKQRTVLDAFPDPVVLYDMSGNVIYINPAFVRVFKWTLEDIIGRRMNFVPEEEWPKTLKKIEFLKRGEGFYGFETRRFDREGLILDVCISAAVWRDIAGTPQGSVIVLRDVTEQKKMEAQLQSAKKMEAIGTLAGGIAHDFNNILGSIFGYTQLALDDAKSGKASPEFLEEVFSSAKRARDLVQQILVLSRQSRLEKKPIEVSLIIKEAAKLIRATLPSNIIIEQEISVMNSNILGD
ncbi:MAG: PAS domain S-box protein [Deltaproteobacteria bacterium]|nr:PAS domain S-box protein [Deltaproteobacteria bacterium]